MIAQGTNAQGLGLIDEDPASLASFARPIASRGTRPPMADLSAGFPAVGNQGRSQTCVAWAVAYAATSFFHRRARGGTTAFSPSFLYNLVHDGNAATCERPTKTGQALTTAATVGAVPYGEFAFDPSDCRRLPTSGELARAANFRIPGFAAFAGDDVATLQSQLAGGTPVIISMKIASGFKAWRSSQVFDGPDDGQRDGHAMVATGYDRDRRAIRLLNSWGTGWGDGGSAWVSERYFRERAGTASFVILEKAP